MPDFSGQSIGRYHIIEPLGQGGMATVYRAFDTRLECEVAVKFIRMERLSPEEVERTLRRFEREAKEVARLTHPNIVKVTDYGDYQGIPYLVMPYLPGGTLKQFAGKALPFGQAARLLAPVARALEAAHQKNLIHRDIKPANILLTEGGQPMLSDFGITKILGLEGGQTLTSTNVAIGTPEYMAPEQWRNQVSPQSDIYSLGVIFYELVTGQKPYTADTPAEIFLKQSTEPLPSPRNFVASLPAEVEQALARALARKPEERYASMGEFAAALEELASQAKTTRPVPLKPKDIQPAGARPGTPAEPPKPARLETFQAQETGPGKRVSPPVGVDDSPTSDGEFTPMGLPIKTAPGRPAISGWVWAAAGIVLLVGVIALAGWGFRQLAASQVPTQTVQALAALQPTGTPVPPAPTQTETPAATATPVPTLTHTLGVGSTRVSPKDGMLQMYVPAGEFLMGSDKAKDSQAYSEELPQHTVYLDAFWIDQTEVTNAEFSRCVTAGQCKPPGNTSSYTRNSYYGVSQYDNYPVIYVDWNQAQAYCAWAGRRLPSEAEWEKAARGTDGRLYPWGDTSPDQSLLNYSSNKGDTTAVRSYSSGASIYGALDMAGNVWEWVNDWYSDTYYQNSLSRNPAGPDSGTSRVLRGGSWNDNGGNVRSAVRGGSVPDLGSTSVGFRCAASP